MAKKRKRTVPKLWVQPWSMGIHSTPRRKCPLQRSLLEKGREGKGASESGRVRARMDGWQRWDRQALVFSVRASPRGSKRIDGVTTCPRRKRTNSECSHSCRRVVMHYMHCYAVERLPIILLFCHQLMSCICFFLAGSFVLNWIRTAYAWAIDTPLTRLGVANCGHHRKLGANQ